MGNFSKSPDTVLKANQDKGYVGIHVEQGVPVLDRDLNLLQDLLAATLRTVVSKYIGDGALANGFLIQAIPSNNDFLIKAGSALVNGIDVVNPVDVRYLQQPGVPPLITPSGPSRTDTVYLDVSLSEVDRTVDSDLGNSGDVGVQTTVRQKLNFTVRVAQDSTALPPSSPGHSFFLLARLNRPATAQIDAQSITDLRARFIPLLQASGLIRELARPVLDPSPNEFSPESAVAGTTFTLFGRNFGIGQTSIRFVTTTTPPTTVPITTGFVATDTQITGQLPANIPVGIYKIIIENEHGSDTTTNAFKVITPGGGLPVFGAPGGQFTPTAGGPGTQVTIFGSNFTNTMTLMFFFLPLIDTSFKATDLSIASIDIEPGPQPQVLPFQFLTSGKIAAEIPGSVTEGQIRFRIMVGTSVVADSSDIFTISGGLPSA